jgi:hypothetical protein
MNDGKAHHRSSALWIPRLELIAAAGFVINLGALAVREIRYQGVFPRSLELLYLMSLLLLVGGVLAARVLKMRTRRRPGFVLDDERSRGVQQQAGLAALYAVLAVQVPFIMGAQITAKALALITLTAGAAVFHAARSWLDRDPD